jgi:hypothetical protein
MKSILTIVAAGLLASSFAMSADADKTKVKTKEPTTMSTPHLIVTYSAGRTLRSSPHRRTGPSVR